MFWIEYSKTYKVIIFQCFFFVLCEWFLFIQCAIRHSISMHYFDDFSRQNWMNDTIYIAKVLPILVNGHWSLATGHININTESKQTKAIKLKLSARKIVPSVCFTPLIIIIRCILNHLFCNVLPKLYHSVCVTQMWDSIVILQNCLFIARKYQIVANVNNDLMYADICKLCTLLLYLFLEFWKQNQKHIIIIISGYDGRNGNGIQFCFIVFIRPNVYC